MNGEPEHGTYTGYQWHVREGVPTCAPCRAAKAAYQRQYRATRPGAREADRAWNKTRRHALERLAFEYPKRFQDLLEEERLAEPRPVLRPVPGGAR